MRTISVVAVVFLLQSLGYVFRRMHVGEEPHWEHISTSLAWKSK